MEKKIDKKVFFSRYKKCSYQKFIDFIHIKDSNAMKDAIFSEESFPPSTKEEINSKMAMAFPKSTNPNKKSFKPPPHPKVRRLSEGERRGSEEKENFFDCFEKKVDLQGLHRFKKNLELSIDKECKICIIKNKLYDLILDPANDPSNITFTASYFFENADKILNGEEEEEDIDLSKDPKIVKIENISRINEYLRYEVKKPLWYVYHQVAKSSFGPLTSENIAEMYNKKVINGESLIRFIDIFTFDNKAGIQYFKLKEIEKKSFLKKISLSNLVHYANDLKLNYYN